MGFTVYWGILMAFSFQNGSMIEIDLGMSLLLFIQTFAYWIAGGGLILAVESYSGAAEVIPGKYTLLQMILLSVTQIFFRTVFWSVEDFARLTYPESHNTGIPYWRLMWFIQQTFEIIGSLVIFGCIGFISSVETEVENGSESKALPENEEY